jgi:hypothetical protein
MRKAVILNYRQGFRNGAPAARAILVLDGKNYLFDMTTLTSSYNPYRKTECMVFKCDKKWKVRSWMEIYTRRGHMKVNRKSMIESIMAFCDLADFEKSKGLM